MSDSENAMKLGNVFPDLSNVTWFLDPRFQRYWKHYHKVMDWYKKHVETYEMLSSKLDSASPPGKPGTSRFSPYSQFRNTQSRKSTNKSPWTFPQWTSSGSSNKVDITETAKRTATAESTCSSQVSHSTQSATAVPSEEFEMEITDEMVEFFAQSLKHKEEREENKRLEKGTVKEEPYIDLEKSNQRKTATTEAPKERPGLRRTKEMKLLYGKGAAMIHGMETATQMTFDRNTDLKKPKLWPNMPLKITFS